MKNIIIRLFTATLLVAVILSGCKQDKTGPLENNNTPPGPVSNVSVQNGPGNATLTYILPTDKDLLYIKAVYKLANGQSMEVKASYYGNKLVVEGFGDTNEHEVLLYAVNRSEKASAPVSVKVKPLENPIWGVYRSLKVSPDFGGVNFKATNPAKADLTIELFIQSKGKLVSTGKNIYTSTTEVDQSIRGLDTVTQKLGITIRDRWLNHTDTLFVNVKPLYETIIPKSGYKEVILPTDTKQQYDGTSIPQLWDGNIMDWPSCVLTSTSTVDPQWITFDVGKLATLSRITIWDYPEYMNQGRTYFYGGDLKEFEVWGTDNPTPDGSFANWVLLGSFTSKKPSGSAYGVQTSEDYAFANAGINYTFKSVSKKVRYLRIKSIKNWQGTSFMSISEVQVYGDPR
ncbi:hypothetical protein CKK33_15355 [Mucilaginibacter sp. MD40]|uniref:DUF4959 domain-containing protein n=1 Tax=Mucilaginibacter sp. MD40 TaxID=2029590 RepID=UPI000BAC9DBD|nr:DUF4959 domain-containing protein [Mucilaginibacter sp. MD40]PAW94796.1 hypothetical protein CKK33_15355 [Mucilaginibacter sp. MD40]